MRFLRTTRLPVLGAFWTGVILTVVGLVLKERSEFLKRTSDAPRKLSHFQKTNLEKFLAGTTKCPIVIGYFGQDEEAKSYATEFKTVFERAGFKVERVSGFMVFEPCTGLHITSFNSDAADAVAAGIQGAFLQCGLSVQFSRIPSKREPAVEFDVYRKPPVELPVN